MKELYREAIREKKFGIKGSLSGFLFIRVGGWELRGSGVINKVEVNTNISGFHSTSHLGL